MQIAVPIIIMLPVFPPFLTSRTANISSRNGMNATKRTDGEMNSPMNVTAAKRKHTKCQAPRRAIAFVMNAIVQRRTKLVFERGYTSANVKSKNATVEFPNAPAKVFPKPKTGRKPSARSVIMLGQSIEMVIHISREPKKTPRTPQAFGVSPHISGMKREPMISARDNTRKNVSFFILRLSPFC